MPATRARRASSTAPAEHSLRALAAQLVRFFLSSCLGLAVDLSVFAALTAAGARPGVANAASSACAVLTTYLAVTRYAFGSRLGHRTLVRFAGAYTASILVFSALVDVLVLGTGWPALAAKAAVLPVSFGVNYLLSRWAFRRPRATGEGA